MSDHNEAFFANHVLGKLSTDLAVIGRALGQATDEEPEKIDAARLGQLYRRLAWTFRWGSSQASSASASPRSRPSRTRR